MYKFHAKPNIVSAIYLLDAEVTVTSDDSPPVVTTIQKGEWVTVMKNSEGVDTMQGYTHEEFMNTFEPDGTESQTFLDSILALLAQ